MLITNVGEKLYSRLKDLFSDTGDITIATGYVSAAGCELLELSNRAQLGCVRLVLGRAREEGLTDSTRQYLTYLHRFAIKKNGGVRVCATGFHSKLYATPDHAVVGSSNLTVNGLNSWTEANFLLESTAAEVVRNEIIRLYDGAIPWDAICDDIPFISQIPADPSICEIHAVQQEAEPGNSTKGIEISLLQRGGNVPAKSGLNWGLAGGRPRDRFECYIRLPNESLRLAEYVFGSLSKGTQFYARTHNGRRFKLVLEGTSHRGGEIAKQISTFGDKSALGRWMIEDCLRIHGGRPVTLDDLKHYGRTTVEFYRCGLAEDGLPIVFMDFGPRSGTQ